MGKEVKEEELRELIDHQEKIREDERKRIAREIHDELGQHLLAFRIEVSLLKQEIFDSYDKRSERIDEILEHVDTTVKSVRTLINNLRPAVLDLGLVASLEWQARDFTRANGIECVFHTNDAAIELDDKPATVLFRVLQEALTNIVKHARADRVDIRLKRDGGNLVLQVSDNGVGMPKVRNRKIKSYGLAGIRERIGMLNGEFKIATGDTGTTLIFTIPANS
ncbi:sensor histidine kinase [Oxalobacter paraformigenes]|uniref:Histidine kinase domain-containing protein n=1 Tax=Oxalobacter paraformigenes TaxID=556268 RepID=C3X5I5_9BURK|nr:sensor histidine kinase [Oxalobacter paraformigenes]EEO28471.1 hypothetical protein OFAG_01624 [Oxalobacter paraformigenes]